MTDTTKTREVLRALVARIVAHGDDVVVEPTAESGGRALWTLRCHPDDESKVLGHSGTHATALIHLVESMGFARDAIFNLKIETPGDSGDRAKTRREPAERYDPLPVSELLSRVLEELSLGEFAVRVRPSTPAEDASEELSFVFEILPREKRDYSLLLVRSTTNGLTLVGSIGTLFRAVARRDGVRFTLEVVRPQSAREILGMK